MASQPCSCQGPSLSPPPESPDACPVPLSQPAPRLPSHDEEIEALTASQGGGGSRGFTLEPPQIDPNLVALGSPALHQEWALAVCRRLTPGAGGAAPGPGQQGHSRAVLGPGSQRCPPWPASTWTRPSSFCLNLSFPTLPPQSPCWASSWQQLSGWAKEGEPPQPPAARLAWCWRLGSADRAHAGRLPTGTRCFLLPGPSWPATQGRSLLCSPLLASFWQAL